MEKRQGKISGKADEFNRVLIPANTKLSFSYMFAIYTGIILSLKYSPYLHKRKNHPKVIYFVELRGIVVYAIISSNRGVWDVVGGRGETRVKRFCVPRGIEPLAKKTTYLFQTSLMYVLV
jgi:hypothetical protein